jgi:hypothetical protein
MYVVYLFQIKIFFHLLQSIFILSSASLPMLQGICMSSINKKIKEKIFSFIIDLEII